MNAIAYVGRFVSVSPVEDIVKAQVWHDAMVLTFFASACPKTAKLARDAAAKVVSGEGDLRCPG